MKRVVYCVAAYLLRCGAVLAVIVLLGVPQLLARQPLSALAAGSMDPACAWLFGWAAAAVEQKGRAH